MVPNKFERHIKEKLESREIQPSTDAWNKLSDQLNNSSQKPAQRGYLWYGIAAGFIAIMFVSVLYFNSENQSVTTNIQVVDTTKEAPKKEKNSLATKEKPFDLKNEEIDKVGLNVSNEKATVQNRQSELKKQLSKVDRVETVSNKIQTSLVTSEEAIDAKVLEVLARVEALENNNEALTDAEVDALLRQAQQELLANKVILKDNNTVDAMALLTDVEDELDQSFRDKIFESLKVGFVKVRTVVANRNN